MKAIMYCAAVFFISITFTSNIEAAATSNRMAPSLKSGISADWQKKWEETLVAAKQESEVLAYLNAPADARIALSEAFNKKYGLKLGVVMGSGGDLQAKLISEYRAGIHQVDVFMPGATSVINAKKQGILSTLEPMLILPEVNNPKEWFSGRLPFFDRDHTVFGYLALKNPDIFYNADLVKAGEITSHLDLLKPQWKGKTVMYDPTLSGAGLAGSYFLTIDWGGPERVLNFITSMVKQQDTMVTKDMRQQVEWVVRGKYLVALWPQLPATSQFLQAGAHLAAASIKERERIAASNGALGVPVNPPHPNATLVFLNWFLSREGQSIAAKAMGAPSARLDVSKEGINPIFIPKQGEQYNYDNEEAVIKSLQFQESVKKLFAGFNK